jgi:hypothetical protein
LGRLCAERRRQRPAPQGRGPGRVRVVRSASRPATPPCATSRAAAPGRASSRRADRRSADRRSRPRRRRRSPPITFEVALSGGPSGLALGRTRTPCRRQRRTSSRKATSSARTNTPRLAILPLRVARRRTGTLAEHPGCRSVQSRPAGPTQPIGIPIWDLAGRGRCRAAHRPPLFPHRGLRRVSAPAVTNGIKPRQPVIGSGGGAVGARHQTHWSYARDAGPVVDASSCVAHTSPSWQSAQ